MSESPESILSLILDEDDPRWKAVFGHAIDRQLLGRPRLSPSENRAQIEAWDRYCAERGKDVVQATAQSLIDQGHADVILNALATALSNCLLDLPTAKGRLCTHSRMIRSRIFDLARWLLALELEELEGVGIDRLALLGHVANLELKRNVEDAKAEIKKSIQIISAIPRKFNEGSRPQRNSGVNRRSRKQRPRKGAIQLDGLATEYTGLIQQEGVLIKKRNSRKSNGQEVALPQRLVKILLCAYAMSFQMARAADPSKADELDCSLPLFLEFEAKDLEDSLGKLPNRTDMMILRRCVKFRNGDGLFTTSRVRKSSIKFSVGAFKDPSMRASLYQDLPEATLRNLGLVDRGKS